MSETPALPDRISALLTAKRVRFEAKAMMGGICFLVNGKMFVGTAKNRLMVRFDPELHDDVLARPGAGPMDFTGRPMRGYVFVKPETLRDDAKLMAWLELALDYNPRAKRSKKAKKTDTKRTTKEAKNANRGVVTTKHAKHTKPRGV